MKKIVLFGATGFTGQEVMRQALADGFRVTVCVRNTAKLGASTGNLHVVVGDVMNPAVVKDVIRGQDAVIQCLGIGGYGDGKPNAFVSDATRIIVAAMNEVGVQRLICMSNAGVGNSYLPWIMRNIVLPYFVKKLELIMQDKEVMETVVMQSGVHWTIVRFPNIVERARRGSVRMSLDGRGVGLTISRVESAQFLLGQVDDSTYIHKALSISN